MSKRRVVVTGLGIISPVGNTIAEAWDNLVAGRTGIARITHFDPTPFASHMAGEVKNFDVGQYLNPKEARRNDIFIQYGLVAAIQALHASAEQVMLADAAIEKGRDPSFFKEMFLEQIKEMEGQLREITGDPNASIPVEKQGAKILYVPLAGSHTILPPAVVGPTRYSPGAIWSV